MSGYDPYSYGGGGGGGRGGPPPPQQPYSNYGPPPPQQQGYGPPPPNNDPRYQQGPPPPPRGYGGPPPPPQQRGYGPPPPVDQGWGDRSRQRRRSASPPPRGGGGGGGGGPPGRGEYGGGGGGYQQEGYRREGDPYRGAGIRPGEPSALDPGRGRRRVPVGEGDTGLTEEEHARIVEERKRKEQPCRTLFVRNVKYGVTADQVRERFERIGDVRTCFDMLEKRGMLFITLYDIRAAILAKDELNRSMINGRPIDVHFSLPRDADLARRCDREKGQGTLALMVHPPPRGPLDERELMERFGAYGEVKSVAVDTSPGAPVGQRLIEYFDSRGSERAFDQLNDQPLAGGRIELRFMWDPPPSLLPRMPPRELVNQKYGYGPAPGSAPPAPAYGTPSGGGYGAPPASGYGAPPPPAAQRGSAWGDAEDQRGVDDRLAQALKVQQLLASLGNAAAGIGGATPPPPPPAAAAPVPVQAPEPAAPSLPPALLALLGKSGTPTPAPAGEGGYSPAPPSAAPAPQQGQAQAPAQVQQLLDLLSQQQKTKEGSAGV